MEICCWRGGVGFYSVDIELKISFRNSLEMKYIGYNSQKSTKDQLYTRHTIDRFSTSRMKATKWGINEWNPFQFFFSSEVSIRLPLRKILNRFQLHVSCDWHCILVTWFARTTRAIVIHWSIDQNFTTTTSTKPPQVPLYLLFFLFLLLRFIFIVPESVVCHRPFDFFFPGYAHRTDVI